MRIQHRLILSAVVFGMPAAQGWSAATQGAARPAAYAVVTLIDAGAPVSARQVTVGLSFEIEAGWHIYWRNPGDSGGPPTVRWSPTNAAAAGDLEWPVPERIVTSDVVNYGYRDRVVFPLTIRLATARRPIDLMADVRYIVCREVCVSSAVNVPLHLVAVPSGAEARAARIREARRRLPRDMPTTWHPVAVCDADGFSLRFPELRPTGAAQFFAFDPEVVDTSAAVVEPNPLNLVIGLHRPTYSGSTPRTVAGVLVLPDLGAYSVVAPVVGTDCGTPRSVLLTSGGLS